MRKGGNSAGTSDVVRECLHVGTKDDIYFELFVFFCSTTSRRVESGIARGLR